MNSTTTFSCIKATDNQKRAPKWDTRLFVVAPLVLMGLGSVVPFGGQAPLMSALTGHMNAASKLTIIARADGTFDIKEFSKEDQWFAPEVVGEGLRITMSERFGAKVQPSSVNVLVQADPGASDKAVITALASARDNGFVRFGFVDPRLGEVVKQFASAPASVVASK